MELCLAADAPLPAETAFAYSTSHPVTALPAAVIARLVNTDGRDSDEADAFDTPHDTPVNVRVGAPRAMSRVSMCSAVASAARANDLPVPFFANLIWQESSFNPRVVSPAGAQGIAQFMPETAKEYGLANPFDPIHALHAAGRFLSKLVSRFGNLGLAAAAYNAGPGRVNEFMTKRRQLPDETKNYVVRITGRPAEKWASRKFVQAPEAKLMPAKAPCVEVAEDVLAQAKAFQLAKLAAAVPTAKHAGKLPRAVNTVKIAMKQVKGKVANALAAKKPAGSSIKLADRIVPDKTADRVSQPGSQKLGRNSSKAAGKTSIEKTPQKSAPAAKRTRLASAR